MCAQVAKGGEAVRAPVALAVVKLLRHLPKQAARAALPPALQRVANLLRLRLQRLRCALVRSCLMSPEKANTHP